MQKRSQSILQRILSGGGVGLLLVFPASTNFRLKSYDFGGAGSGVGQSGSHQLNGSLGQPATGSISDGTVGVNAGSAATTQANVPQAASFTNPDSYYNKLHLVVNPAGNPTDTTFAIAVSTDNFVTTTYVQSDHTLGATLNGTNYLTYTSWGGASGFDILGLQPSTAYKVKIKAFPGDFSETGFGPTATASTTDPYLIFDIDVSATDQQTDPPYQVDLGVLDANTVESGTSKVWTSLETNGQSGASVYISGQNAGLRSAAASYTLPSVSGDLDSLGKGEGAQVYSTTQTAGGSLTPLSPYDGTGNQVGIVDGSVRELLSVTSPIFGGRSSLLLKAKASNLTPAANDYQERMTMVAAARY